MNFIANESAVWLLAGLGFFGYLVAILDAKKPGWADADAIPGLTRSERAEYRRLSAVAERTAALEVRLAALDIAVDADLAGLGIEREQVPALKDAA